MASRRSLALATASLLAGSLLAAGPATTAAAQEPQPSGTEAHAGEHDHSETFGHPVAPIDVTLTQPDGATFEARPWGHGARTGYERADGYTVVRSGREWRYADGVDSSGNLRPSSRRADAPPPAGVKKRTRPTADNGPMLEQPDETTAGSADDGGTPLSQAPLDGTRSGTAKSLVILAQFQDQKSLGTTPAQWSAKYFGATGSVREFYTQASYGTFTFGPAAEASGTANDGVVGWVTLPYNHPNPGQDTDGSNQQLTADAIKAADPAVNFASFDTDGDGVIKPKELHVTVIVAGFETSYGGPELVCGASVWGHRWGTNAVTPTVDGKTVGRFGYTQFGEHHCDEANYPGHMATIGIMAHEMGHDIGWPDLYDTDQTSEGIGVWSLMATGSWGRTTGRLGSLPTLPDAFSKYYQGWVTPTEYPSAAVSGVGLGTAATTASVALLGSNPSGVDWTFNGASSGTGEYFLAENRQKTGYDAGLPGCGVLVWHIDESAPANNSANQNEHGRRLVDLAEADGLRDLDFPSDYASNRGDAGDPFPGSSNNRTISDFTNPSTKYYSGASSGKTLSTVTTACAPTMTVDINKPGSPPPLPANDGFANAVALSGSAPSTSGRNKYATVQTGEPVHAGSQGASVWWTWTAPAAGKMTISTQGSGFDTVLAVYTGSAVNGLTSLASNDDAATGGYQSVVKDVPVTAGTTYRIAVDGYTGAGGAATGDIALGLQFTSSSVALPALSIGDVTVPEGDVGSVVGYLPVRLSAASQGTVTVNYAAAAGSASTADFTGTSGTLSFPAGTTFKSIPVTLRPDSQRESAESLTVSLTGPVGATLADAGGLLTIADNDSAPRLAVGDLKLYEGDGGTASAMFTVRLDGPAATDVSASYATAAGTATDDFTATSGTVTFAAGQVSKRVIVPIKGDTADEAHETFTLRLSNASGAAIADGTGQATILDDDPVVPSTMPALRIGSLTLDEGEGSTTGYLTVRLAAPSAETVTATFTRKTGTAGTADFSGGTGTISIAPGATAAYIPVVVTGDAVDEVNESFSVELSNASGAELRAASGSVLIRDDDLPGSLAVSDVRVVEGSAATGSAVFTVRLSAPAAGEVNVAFATGNGTAFAGSDFSSRSGTLTFAVGQVSKTVSVPLAADAISEGNETFELLLSSPTGAAITDTSGLATLQDDDS